MEEAPTVLSKLQKWADYEGLGEPVWPTRFIPMKTPLSSDIIDQWALPENPKYPLTISSMLQEEESKGRHVGLILDLSNHECLYKSNIPATVKYQHIRFIAKECPPLVLVHTVAEAALNFWRDSAEAYIAIHCAYGFNRTGFVVASFLIEHYALDVQTALRLFRQSRPPGLKHERFKAELIRRYGPNGTRVADPFRGPRLPPLEPGPNSGLPLCPDTCLDRLLQSCSPDMERGPDPQTHSAKARSFSLGIEGTEVQRAHATPDTKGCAAICGQRAASWTVPGGKTGKGCRDSGRSHMERADSRTTPGPDNDSLGVSNRQILADMLKAESALDSDNSAVQPRDEGEVGAPEIVKHLKHPRHIPDVRELCWTLPVEEKS